MQESGLSVVNDSTFLYIACQCFSEQWHVRCEFADTRFFVSAGGCFSAAFPCISILSTPGEIGWNELFSCHINRPRIAVGLFITLSQASQYAGRRPVSHPVRPTPWRGLNGRRHICVRFQKFNL